MDKLVAGINRRYALYAETLNLVLPQCPVDNFMTHRRIEQCHNIQRLNHVRTVGTCKRDISAQLYITTDGPDAARNNIVGHVLSLSVGIENCKQQR